MSAVPVNLDDLRRLREEGLRHGPAHRTWFKAAEALMDAFPAVYDTARRMNERQVAMLGQRGVLVSLLESATAILRTIDPEDTSEKAQLDALIDVSTRACRDLLVASTAAFQDPQIEADRARGVNNEGDPIGGEGVVDTDLGNAVCAA